MALLKISKQDVLRQQLLEPNWYKVAVESITPKASKDKQSVNFEFSFLFEVDGRTMAHNFNTKAMGMAVPCIEAITGEKIDAADIEIDTDKLLKRKLQVKVENDTYEGRMVNRITNFLPYEADVTPAF